MDSYTIYLTTYLELKYLFPKDKNKQYDCNHQQYQDYDTTLMVV